MQHLFKKLHFLRQLLLKNYIYVRLRHALAINIVREIALSVRNVQLNSLRERLLCAIFLRRLPF
jgi:hypothetical protein